MFDARRDAQEMKAILALETEPIAAFLLPPGQVNAVFVSFQRVEAHRYCQALMRARYGESVRLEPSDLACPAASAAFGWSALPDGLASGKALVGFGIAAKPSTGKVMFDGMPHLARGRVAAIAACPLGKAPFIPDVVVVEALPEQLMWLALADLNLAGGKRRSANTAVLQATCVDATVIPLVTQRLNFSLGCYGCREATDMTPQETILGFPGNALHAIVAELERLNVKAIGRSRTRAAFHHIQDKKEHRT